MDSKTLLERANYLKVMGEEARLNAELYKKEADEAIEHMKTTGKQKLEEHKTLESDIPPAFAALPPLLKKPVAFEPVALPLVVQAATAALPPLLKKPVALPLVVQDTLSSVMHPTKKPFALNRKQDIELFKKNHLQSIKILNAQKFRRGMFS